MTYCLTFSSTLSAKLYERDLARFLEDAYLRVGGTAATAAVASTVASTELLNAGSSKRTPKASTAGVIGGSGGGVTQLLGSDKETWGSENSITDRER